MEAQKIIRLVRINESIFGLPWVIAGALLPFTQRGFASHLTGQHWFLAIWILTAFISARIAGMSFNRLIDRKIDAENPRTKHRMVAKGEISPFEVGGIAAGSCGIFIFSCYMINEICFFMSPLAVLLLFGYSYTKRFTSCCHFVLGLIQLCGPVFAWAAITGQLAFAPFLLGLALMCSIAANDIIYALQDLEFDQKYGLKSIPVLAGSKGSIWISRGLQTGTVILLMILGVQLELPPLYYGGIAVIAGIYLYFQQLIDLNSKTTINRAFFRCNGFVALILLLTIIGSLIWPALL